MIRSHERWLRGLCTLILCAAGYGFAIGAGKNLLYAWRSSIKFPLLLLGTAGVGAIAFAVTAAFLGLRLPLATIERAALALFPAVAVLLAGLAPVTLFLARTMVQPTADGLGGYPGFVLCNIAFVAVAGTVALAHQARILLREAGVGPRRARLVVLVWLVQSLAVGGQLAFWLRPFFGIASLSGEPPFLLGSEPTVTGARNFFEVVWQFAFGIAH